MITKTELSKIWTEIVSQTGQNIGRRADPGHPLDFFVSYDEYNRMQLMLITDHEHVLPSSSKQILVRGNKRTDGKTAICFSLENNELKDQFVSLCWDIMDCSYRIQDKNKGVQIAIKRFKMWQKLFAEEKTRKMSEAEAKGLLGELTVLKEICVKKYGIDEAILGWVGPMGADRDFEYSDCWYESKFVSLSMDKVKISSLDQLDTDQNGVLVICRYEKTSGASAGFVTINNLIKEISDLASYNENTLVSFVNRVMLTGYDANSEQSTQAYMYHRLEKYNVKENDFPRIRRSDVDVAISDGEYLISIPAIQRWKEED